MILGTGYFNSHFPSLGHEVNVRMRSVNLRSRRADISSEDVVVSAHNIRSYRLTLPTSRPHSRRRSMGHEINVRSRRGNLRNCNANIRSINLVISGHGDRSYGLILGTGRYRSHRPFLEHEVNARSRGADIRSCRAAIRSGNLIVSVHNICSYTLALSMGHTRSRCPSLGHGVSIRSRRANMQSCGANIVRGNLVVSGRNIRSYRLTLGTCSCHSHRPSMGDGINVCSRRANIRSCRADIRSCRANIRSGNFACAHGHNRRRRLYFACVGNAYGCSVANLIGRRTRRCRGSIHSCDRTRIDGSSGRHLGHFHCRHRFCRHHHRRIIPIGRDHSFRICCYLRTTGSTFCLD